LTTVRWEADVTRRAAQARDLYARALALDPDSGAAASGLAYLLHARWEQPVPEARSAAAAAEQALRINPDEPVAT
jgi:tetratricopeptide (TPR) repeat protein